MVLLQKFVVPFKDTPHHLKIKNNAADLNPDAAIRRARATAMLGDLGLSAPQELYQVRCSSFSLSSSVPYALNTLKREQHTKSQPQMIAADGARPIAAFGLKTTLRRSRKL
jgi:hypothetical protein